MIDNYIVNKKVTCKEAMKLLNENEYKILFVVGDGNYFIGTLTDGDIRRHLIAGGEIGLCVDDVCNKEPIIAKDVKQAKELLKGNGFVAIPVVKKGCLIDILFDDGKRFYRPIENVDVIINAGGKGTRLDPFTKVLPKPLIPVGDKPIIEHIMQEFGNYSLNAFSIIVNYKKELLKAYFYDKSSKYDITWYIENAPLGTGGGLSLLKGKINKTFFFVNCDILLKSDYESMVRYHKENNYLITMVCAYKNIVIPYGVIEMGRNGSILNMKEKPEFSFLTNTGMYIVEPEVLDYIENDVPVGFPDIVAKVQKAGKKVGVYPVGEDEWMDMGQLDELEKMRDKLYGK